MNANAAASATTVQQSTPPTPLEQVKNCGRWGERRARPGREPRHQPQRSQRDGAERGRIGPEAGRQGRLDTGTLSAIKQLTPPMKILLLRFTAALFRTQREDKAADVLGLLADAAEIGTNIDQDLAAVLAEIKGLKGINWSAWRIKLRDARARLHGDTGK